jgi:hypothetical protein
MEWDFVSPTTLLMVIRAVSPKMIALTQAHVLTEDACSEATRWQVLSAESTIQANCVILAMCVTGLGSAYLKLKQQALFVARPDQILVTWTKSATVFRCTVLAIFSNHLEQNVGLRKRNVWNQESAIYQGNVKLHCQRVWVLAVEAQK